MKVERSKITFTITCPSYLVDMWMALLRAAVIIERVAHTEAPHAFDVKVEKEAQS